MRDFKQKVVDDIGGPLTKGDWGYLGLLVLLAVFMGAMTPVWMETEWIVSLVHWMGLPT